MNLPDVETKHMSIFFIKERDYSLGPIRSGFTSIKENCHTKARGCGHREKEMPAFLVCIITGCLRYTQALYVCCDS